MLGIPISTGFCTGPNACSSNEAARPSQNCLALKRRLITVGACRPPFLPPTPFENWLGSAKPLSGMWQEAHERLPSIDRLLSKYNRLPSLILSSVKGLSLGIL